MIRRIRDYNIEAGIKDSIKENGVKLMGKIVVGIFVIMLIVTPAVVSASLHNIVMNCDNENEITDGIGQVIKTGIKSAIKHFTRSAKVAIQKDMMETFQFIAEHPQVFVETSIASDIVIENIERTYDGIKITEIIDSIRYTVEYKQNDEAQREDVYVNGEFARALPYELLENLSVEEKVKKMNKANATAIKMYKEKHG